MANFKMQNNLVLSVGMITYNHENYIREAIEGVLIQKTEFKIELVIGEDCSTDSTRVICEEYAKKYPHIIRLLAAKKNMGMIPNFIRTLKSCTGKYIALCEGDDYWTDPNKLQKQIGFMEKNPEYSFSFHAAGTLNMETRNIEVHKYNCENGFRSFTLKDVILKGGGFMTTNTVIFKTEFIRNLPEWFINSPTGDFALSLILSSQGKVAYFNDVMSVYRRGVPGSWTDTMKDKNQMRKLYNNTEKMLLSFNRYTSNRYFITIMRKIIKNRVNLFRHIVRSALNKIQIL
jgi:glycosyltransferase involved in cell wall biosynthesis